MNDLHTAELIKAYIDAQPPKEYTSWRASSIGTCPRAHYFKRLGIEATNPPDDRTMRVFKAGDVFHDFVENITKEEASKAGYVVSAEEELYDKSLDLGGRYDLLLEKDDFRQLRDIKTQHSGMFHRLRREAANWFTADQTPEERQKLTQEAFLKGYKHQVMQLSAYMLLLRQAGTPVNEGVIVRISKDDLSLMEVHFKPTLEMENEVLAELELLNKHWAEKTLPPCTCADTSWGVKYCNYADPSSEKYVEVEAKSGKTYKVKQLTKCCSDKLIKEKNGNS